jgi:RNA polymerase sigma-70 factor (ECF subfamily)
VAHYDDLIAYARRVLGGRGAAEDVVQEAYLRLLERAAENRPPVDARPWLFRVVRNLAIDHRRRSEAAPMHADDPGVEGAADVVERRAEAGFALAALAALPPRQRRAVTLDQAGAPAADIARALDTNANAVHQVLFRARRRLRQVRAGVWTLLPLPVARMLGRLVDARALDTLMVSSSGGGGRVLPLAGAAGVAIAGIAGLGAAVHSATQDPSERRAPVAHTLVRPVAVRPRPPAPLVAPPAAERLPVRVVAHRTGRTGSHAGGGWAATGTARPRRHAPEPAAVVARAPARPLPTVAAPVASAPASTPPASVAAVPARQAPEPDRAGRQGGAGGNGGSQDRSGPGSAPAPASEPVPSSAARPPESQPQGDGGQGSSGSAPAPAVGESSGGSGGGASSASGDLSGDAGHGGSADGGGVYESGPPTTGSATGPAAAPAPSVPSVPPAPPAP